jgi:hypothetical protein
MLPEHVCSLIATLSGPSCKPPLNWNLHLTSEGEERTPFNQHVQRKSAGEGPPSQGLLPSLGNLPPTLKLPTELQWRIMDFCTDPATLWQFMHTSRELRTEASKRFWADPHTYYLIEAPWLIDGGGPGHTGYDMAFLTHVQNIEVEYSIDADALLRPRGENGLGSLMNNHLIVSFWSSLKQRCPSVRRVVFNQTWHTRLQSRGDSEKPTWISLCLKVLIGIAPPEVEVSAFVLSSAIHNGSGVMTRIGRREGRRGRACCGQGLPVGCACG